MSIAVFNSFSQASEDVATGAYSWVYSYGSNYDDWFGTWYDEVATKTLTASTQTSRTYTLMGISVAYYNSLYQQASGIIQIQTDIVNPHPTIKIEGANSTETIITSDASSWTYDASTNSYKLELNTGNASNPDLLWTDVWKSFTGETWTQWQASGGGGSVARASDADDGATITVTLSKPES
jgi:hypothetical protein